MIGSLPHLIRGAAIEAILDGTEKITRSCWTPSTSTTPPSRNQVPGRRHPPGSGPPVTAEAARPPLRPLPVRPRPASGEPPPPTRRLALANHLRPTHLRHYLKDPAPAAGSGSAGSPPSPTGPNVPAARPRRPAAARRYPRERPPARQKKPPRNGAGSPAAIARDHSPPERATPLWCSFCSKDTGIGRQARRRPGVRI